MNSKKGTFELIKGDITSLHCDVIVNAANESLRRGGGVCGCIHRVAGPRMEIECISKAPCPTGSFKFTGAYNLPCKEVAHAVGPIWQGGTNQEAEKLANCYEEVIKAVYEKGYCSVAFPFISSNIFGYPREECANVALTSIRKMIEIYPVKVIMCAYSDEDYKLFQDVWNESDKLTINKDVTAGATEKSENPSILSPEGFFKMLGVDKTSPDFDALVAETEQIIKDREIETEDEKRFRQLLLQFERTGMESLLETLKNRRFFTAPASVNYHSNFKGGLVNHSLKVYDCAMSERKRMLEADPSLEKELSEESVTICALLHDVCKFDEYGVDAQGSAKHIPTWFPIGGHGDKSVISILAWGVRLEPAEILAIKWHMGEKYVTNKTDKEYCRQAMRDIPLCKLICKADYDATH